MHITNQSIKTIIVFLMILSMIFIGHTNPSTSNQFSDPPAVATPTIPPPIIITSKQIEACQAIDKKYSVIRRQYEKLRAGDPTKVVQLSSRYGLDRNMQKTFNASAYYLPGNYCSNGEAFTEGWSIAVDQYYPAYPAGTIIRLHAKDPDLLDYCNGWGKITDCGDFYYLGRTLDLGMTSYNRACHWGVDQIVITHVIPPGMLTTEQEQWLKDNCRFQKPK